ncbi:DNA translocase FtsK [Nitrincola tapanii]|uniref:DNA translocase FtsK n=1 Tax=Nitrincola tapanii TaxID=1708751 RepID=A0A5A9W3W6_9GAMM|nr:DNA translocase FtsK [Nitrincola tapanii]KAA0875397.1 DNA translocase FtsK [Nitrincola tapanii]
MKATKAPQTLSDHLARVGKESGLILFIGVALALCLAVWSYDARDPGWSHLGYQPQVSNLMGQVGAWLADFLISFLGFSAWLLPPMLLWPALRFLRRRQVGMIDAVPYIMLRMTGAAFVLIPLAMLASMHVANGALSFPFSAGGLVGLALSDLAVSLFSLPGSTLIATTLLLFGLTLYMETSWQGFLEGIGRVIWFIPDSLARLGQLSLPKLSLPKVPIAKPKMPSVSLPEIKVPSFKTKTADVEIKTNSRVEPDLGVPSFAPEPMPPEPAPLHPLPINEALEPHLDLSFKPVPELDTPESPLDFSTALEPNIQAPRVEEGFKNGSNVEATRKQLKIVPLSEAHQPLQESLDPVSEIARRVSVRMSLPSLDLLDAPELKQEQGYSEEQLEQMSRLLEEKLKDFSVIAEVVEVNPGPVITRFEIQPAPGVKASKISNLARDLARSMAVSSVRVVEVIPGKSVVGIEIPNESRQVVHLKEVLGSKAFSEAKSHLTLALGNDIAGNPVVTNLAKMPHLLVAGTTGSGKSVGVNAMLLSLLFKATPEEVRLILVDPKMLELSIYEGIPHLLTPVITDMKEAAGGLRWCVGEMERRYRLMAKMGVRNIAGYNEKVLQAEAEGTPLLDPLWKPQDYGLSADEPAPALTTLPYIVVVIDEFADMMMMVGKKVEELIARIAQKARAAGIHLILATQRPSVDVITGLIKANVPTRIAFQVSSKIDSRTILDQSGAENLLGNGDMLFLPAGTSIPNRVHGAFVSDDEVHRTVEAWKQMGPPNYIEDLLSEGGSEESAFSGGSGGLYDDEQDALYDEAVAFVTESRKASISAVQRKLKIGYNRAARMIETMEAAGVVTPAGSNGQREVLAPPPPRD